MSLQLQWRGVCKQIVRKGVCFCIGTCAWKLQHNALCIPTHTVGNFLPFYFPAPLPIIFISISPSVTDWQTVCLWREALHSLQISSGCDRVQCQTSSKAEPAKCDSEDDLNTHQLVFTVHLRVCFKVDFTASHEPCGLGLMFFWRSTATRVVFFIFWLGQVGASCFTYPEVRASSGRWLVQLEKLDNLRIKNTLE